MSYASSDPRTQGAAAPDPLGSVGWRLLHSLWLVPVLFGCGMVNFVGFLYVAMVVRTRRWWSVAALWTGACSVVWAVNIVANEVGRSAPYDEIGAVLMLIVWVGSVVHGFVVNRDYLRWRASARPWYDARGLAPAPLGPPPSVHPSVSPSVHPPEPVLGVDAGAYYAPPARPAPPAPPAPPAAPVDLNAAAVDELVRVPGLDEGLAARLVAARDARGGFADLDDAVRTVGLQPHQLVRIRDHVTVTPRPGGPQQRPEPPPRPSGGRVLDI